MTPALENLLWKVRYWVRKIQWDGAADTFTKRLTRQLYEFGQVAPGKLALVALLEEAKGEGLSL